MSDYISREQAIAALQDTINDPACPIFIAAYVEQILSQLPAAEVKTLEKIGEEVDEALCILDEARDDGMDYGYYRDLHDAIAGISVPDFGADGKEAE